MGLQLILGGAGSGKSTWIFDRIIGQSMAEEGKNFFILVPEQFTMQTQMDLVMRHPKGGIMNIDVLSFGRLAYRIQEERGGSRISVLDDTGKSLILRRIAEEKKAELPVLGSHLKKQGYIHQVKSSISEFMQYRIGESQLEEMLKISEKRGSLKGKLKDLKELYCAFRDYLSDHYITTEGIYDRLAVQLENSALIAGSVVVLDGFTGFTPVQLKVIEQLILRAEKVYMTLTLEENKERRELFDLSHKTRQTLERIAVQAGKEIEKPIWVRGDQGRFRINGELRHLEKYLFSAPVKVYEGPAEKICIREAQTMDEEVMGMCRSIRSLLDKGYYYRDIAVITGDLEGYRSHIEEGFANYGFPFFMDQTRNITLNPFVEYIRSAIRVITTNYSYEAMFHYLKSGMADYQREETDRLENYCLAFGIRGKRAWRNLFVRIPDGNDGAEELKAINETRARIAEEFQVLTSGKKKVKKLAEELYVFLTEGGAYEKLREYEKRFAEQQDKSKEREFAQIYRLVMELLDQIVSLLGEEEMTWEEFGKLLDAGFDEIQVGVIPQVVDKIVVGDMERTRLGEIRALFFLGMNEGKIPRLSEKGGILSQMEREFLETAGWELAPSSRNQLFIQRFYLYLNVTKPSSGLYLSYALKSDEGRGMKQSYFIDVIKRIFPGLKIVNSDWEGLLPQTTEGERMLAAELTGRYRENQNNTKENQTLLNLLSLLKTDFPEEKWVEDILDAGFFSAGEDKISKETARLLYGSMLMSSVSRLERMAACAYAHFLRYGLQLKARDEYQLEAVDLGNIYHGVLEVFSNVLKENNYTWDSFPEEEGRLLLKRALDTYAVSYGNTILFSSAANTYLLEKMEQILWRTVRTLQFHVQQGSFRPRHFELSFSALEDLDSVTIRLNEKEKLRLGGRIDRLDTLETEDRIYVKVMDYKSSGQKFQLASFYQGLQLQLVVYLQAAMELEQKKNPDKKVLPGALLYYRLADPIVELEEETEPERIEESIKRALRTTGIINEAEEVIHGLDDIREGKSLAVPIEYRKDGSLGNNSSVYDEEHIQLLLRYSRKKAAEIGTDILNGKVEMNPIHDGKTDSCTYCEYKPICSFDEKATGFEKRHLDGIAEEEIWQRIRTELGENKE